MKVELHLHTSLYSGCSLIAPAQAMEALSDARYDAVYLTEHDTVWPEDGLAVLRRDYPHLAVFGGLEKSLTLDSGAFVHLLILGTTDPTYLRMDDPAAVLRRARRRGHLTVLAHPFRWDGAAELLDGPDRPDALELRTNNHVGPAADAAAEAAERLGLPLVNSGDVHSAAAVNKFWIETQRPLHRGLDIRRIVREGAYVNRTGR